MLDTVSYVDQSKKLLKYSHNSSKKQVTFIVCQDKYKKLNRYKEIVRAEQYPITLIWCLLYLPSEKK